MSDGTYANKKYAAYVKSLPNWIHLCDPKYNRISVSMYGSSTRMYADNVMFDPVSGVYAVEVENETIYCHCSNVQIRITEIKDLGEELLFDEKITS